MSATNAFGKLLLDHVFMKTVFTQPSNLWVGLSSSDPGETGLFTGEPVGNGYARVSTSGATWSNATNADPSVTDNIVVVTFSPASGGDWVGGSNLTHFFLVDSSTAGIMYASGMILTPQPILNGDAPSFAIGTLIISLD